MFCNFYLVKNHNNAKNSTTTKAREKISTDLESLEFEKNFDVCLTKFKNNQILLNKITHRSYLQPSNLPRERTSFIIVRNKLECFSQAGLFKQLLSLSVRSGAPTWFGSGLIHKH